MLLQTYLNALPKAWSPTTVGDTFEMSLGKMLDAEKNTGTPKPFLGNRSVRWGRIDVSEIGRVPLTASDLVDFRLKTGDLLACEGGEVGRCAIWRDQLPECYFQKALHRLRTRGNYLPELLQAIFDFYTSEGFFADFVTQTSIAHLPKEKLAQLPVPGIPLPEQRAIAEALTDADALVASLERLLAKKRRLQQGAMQQLLTGHTRLPGFDGAWEEKTLSALATITIGGTPPRANANNWNGKRPWLSIGDLHGKRVSTSKERITDSAAAGQTLVPAGTLMMSFKLSLGRLAFAATDLYTNEAICHLRDLQADAEFLYHQLQRVDFSLFGTLAVKGYTLNQASLAKVEVSLPPRQEQEAIGEVLRELDDSLEHAAARLAKAKRVKLGLMQQLLTGRTRLA